MANYYLDVSAISRGKERSVTKLLNYISGKTLHDCYNGESYYRKRSDVAYCNIYLPRNAPADFNDMQTLCNKIDEAEKRYDARTARVFIGSLPNELSVYELKRIVNKYIEDNFVKYGLCAIAAIHKGENRDDPARNNPHVHIIVTTRTVDADGFSKKKYREQDSRKYIGIWREQWALVQNRAYERNGLDMRVSHETLEVQGIDREPRKHLNLMDWQKERRGEYTEAGNENRLIKKRNEERNRSDYSPKRKLEIDRSR